MMTVGEVIGAYVRDVARLLPRAKRSDVAFELAALLHEELAARATEAGRAQDRDMAMALLASHGTPAQVAARYHLPEPLIDPLDNHSVLIWLLAGVLVITVDGTQGGAAVLVWLGMLFVAFTLRGWLRRRSAGRFTWKPHRDPHPEYGARWPALLTGLGLLVFPVAMYLVPQAFVQAIGFGRAAPWVAFTDMFEASWQRAALSVVLVGYCANHFAVAAQDGWRRWSRRTSVVLGLALSTLLAVHAVPMATLFGGESFDMFAAAGVDAIARPWFGVAAGITWLGTLYDIYLLWVRVEPAPSVSVLRPG